MKLICSWICNFLNRKKNDRKLAEIELSDRTITNLPNQFDPLEITPELRLKNIFYSYSGSESDYSLVDVNMDLQQGKIVSLLGHNGAGKSTILNLISGLLTPTKGKIDFKESHQQISGKIGYCSSDSISDRYTTLYEHLEFIANIKNIPKREIKSQIDTHAEMLQLKEKLKQPISDLSGGTDRKVNLISALLGNPRVIILDEPTRGVDTESRQQI